MSGHVHFCFADGRFFFDGTKGGNQRDSMVFHRCGAHVGPLVGLQNWEDSASNRGGTRFHGINHRFDLVHFSTLT